MLVEKCNRCRKETPYNHYKFKIEEKSISGSNTLWSDLCTPETRLDDLHLCPACMKDFIDFIKEGKK